MSKLYIIEKGDFKWSRYEKKIKSSEHFLNVSNSI